VARWAAVAAVAAGAWLEFARDAEAAVTAYYRNESDSGGYWYYGYGGNKPWWYNNTSYNEPDNGGTGNDIHFNNSKDCDMYVNDRWFKVNYMEFESSSCGRTFNKVGTDVGLNIYYGMDNKSANEQTFNVPISFDNNQQSVTASSGNITFNSPLYLNATVLFAPANSKTITVADLSGSSDARRTGGTSGTLTLTGASSGFSGTLYVGTGTVNIARSSTGNWGGTSSKIIVTGGSHSQKLNLSGNVTVKSSLVALLYGSTCLYNVSGNNTIEGTLGVGNNATVTSTAGKLTIGTLGATNTMTITGAGDVVVNMYTNDGTKYITKTGTGTLQIINSAGGSARRGLALGAGTLSLTSAGVVTNLAITNTTAGTVIDVNGAVGIGVMNIKASTTIQLDVGTTGQNVCESLTTRNSGGWKIDSDFNVKLTPGSSFNSANSATWTILTTQGSFDSTDLGHVKPDTTAFSGVASSCFAKSISGKSIVVTYTPADVAQTTAVTVAEDEFTYDGDTIALEGAGGDGTGTAVYTFGTTLKSGSTGTGSLTSAGVLTVTAAGTFVFDVTREASTGYTARTDEVTITVNKGNQTITGLGDINKTYGDGTFNLGATSSAGLTVTYTITPSSVATVSGSTVTIAGAGTATITASQAGDDKLWNAAADVTATLTVNKGAQTLSFASSSVTLDGDHSSVTVTATAGHGTPTITYTSSSTGIAGVGESSGEVTRGATGYGNVTITATAAETANYGSKTATCTVKVMGVRPSASGSITGVGSVTPTSFSVGYSRGAGATHNVLLAREGSAPAAPSDGTGPAAQTATSIAWGSAAAYPSSGTKVLVHRAVGSGSIAVSGATPATHYHLALYGRTPNSATAANQPFFTYATTPATRDFWTLATEPTGQAGSLAAGTVGSRKASMTWAAGSWTAASGETASLKTLLIVVPSGSSVTAPTDGVTYSAGDTIGAGTVAFAGTGTSAEVTGLTPEQTYTVYAYAYAEGGDGTTANYLTTSPASRSVTTIASQGPTVWATGVTATNYLLNWTPVAGETTGYDVSLDENSSFSSPWRVTPFTNNFTAGEGWERSETSTGSGAWLTVPSGTASGNEEKWYLKGVQRRTGPSDTATVGGVTDTGYLYLTTTGDYVDTPVLYGDLSEIVVGWRRGGGDRSLRIDILKPDRSDFKTGVASWSIAGTATAGVVSTNIFTNSIHMSGGAGYRIRFYNSSSTAGTIYLHHIHLKVAGSAAGYPGYGMEAGGLTSGSTYYAKVRKNPDGDWSDELGVKAGVVPATVSSTSTRNSVTFTWTDTQSGGVGYAVQVSKTAAASTWADKSAGTAALALDSFGSKDWKYIGATATTSSGTLGTAPGYASGHIPGVAGNGLESKSFPLAGATGVRVSFTVEPFNLNQTGGQLSDGRVEVYYQIDDGNWNFLGTAAPVSTSTGANAAFDVPAGALAEGARVAFRLMAPNAHKYGTS
jgi:hypothetical protein